MRLSVESIGLSDIFNTSNRYWDNLSTQFSTAVLIVDDEDDDELEDELEDDDEDAE